MSEVLLVSKEQNIKTLARIDKILNCRFEKEKKLYLDKQLKYEIRKKLANGEWQGIAQGVGKTESISEDIIVNEILNSAWLVNKKIKDRDYKQYVEPLLDCCEDEVYYKGMENILKNKIEVNKEFKLILLKKYYNKKPKKELIKFIEQKDVYLENEKLCFEVLKKIIYGNGSIEEKMETLIKAYENYKIVEKNKEQLKEFWSVLMKKESEKVIEAIMETYIKNHDFNENLWISIIGEKYELAMKEIEKFAGSNCFDRYILRSLIRAIHLNILKGKDSNKKKKAVKSLMNIIRFSNINSYICFECKKSIERCGIESKIKNELLNEINKHNYWGMPGRGGKLTIMDIEEINILKNGSINDRNIYDFFENALEQDLTKRIKIRLDYLMEEYKKLEEKNIKIRKLLIDNHRKDNLSKLIFYLIDIEVDTDKSEILDEVIENSATSLELEDKLIEYIKEKHPRNEKLIRFVHREDFEVFKEVYGRKL